MVEEDDNDLKFTPMKPKKSNNGVEVSGRKSILIRQMSAIESSHKKPRLGTASGFGPNRSPNKEIVFSRADSFSLQLNLVNHTSMKKSTQ